MYTIEVEHSFDSAHFLAGHSGECANIHGHRWRVELKIAAKELIESGPSRGMIADFADLKKDIRAIIDYYDHALIIEEGTLRKETFNCLKEDGFRIVEVAFRPTAENFSCFFYHSIRDKGYNVKMVTVHETPVNSASYEI